MPVSVRALGFNNFPEVMEKSKVRRCLFGKPDHESLRKDLDIQLKNTRTEMRSTWNFDAELDKPLDGRYEWTLIKEDDYAPAYYSKGYRPTKFRKRLDLSSDSQSVSSQHVQCVTPLRTELQFEHDSEDDMQRENETTPEMVPQRQSRIDEHFVKRKGCKRRLSHSSSSSDEENSLTEERNTKLRKLE